MPAMGPLSQPTAKLSGVMRATNAVMVMDMTARPLIERRIFFTMRPPKKLPKKDAGVDAHPERKPENIDIVNYCQDSPKTIMAKRPPPFPGNKIKCVRI